MKILGFIANAPSGKQYLAILTPDGAMHAHFGPRDAPVRQQHHYVTGGEGKFSEGDSKITQLWRSKVVTGEYTEQFAAIIDVPSTASPKKMARLVMRAAEDGITRSEAFARVATEYRSNVNSGGAGQPARTPHQHVAPRVADRTQLPHDSSEVIVRANGERYLPRSLDGHADVAALRAFRTLDTPINVLLVGPAGSGKTGLAEAAHGDELITIQCHGDMGVDQIVGKLDPDGNGGFHFVEGPLIRAMKNGLVVLIDEINKLPGEVLAVFHSVADGRGVLHVDDRPSDPIVTAQPGFSLIGTLNPDSMGANGLPEAITSRFAVSINVGPDYVAAAALGVPRKFITVAQNLASRNTADPDRHPVWVPQMRELLDAKKLIDLGMGETFAARALLNQCPYPEDVPELAEVLRQVLGTTVVPLSLGEHL